MNLLNKHFWKFFAGLLIILALGYVAIYASYFYAQNQSAGEAKTLEPKNSLPAR